MTKLRTTELENRLLHSLLRLQEKLRSQLKSALFSLGPNFKRFCRKTIIMLISFTFTSKISLVIIGIFNRILGKPIKSIFLCYPADEKYAHKYAFKWLFRYSINNPLIVGAYYQNHKIGLIFAAYVNEKHFSKNREYLSGIQKKVNIIRLIVGADFAHFAGSLPSEMNRFSLIDKSYFEERCASVAEIVLDAEKSIRNIDAASHDKTQPVLLLGGKGSIGQVLKDRLQKDDREVYTVDLGEDFPENVKNKKAVLIDVSRRGVLESRLDTLWPDLVILNESFPEPNEDLVLKLRNKGIKVYHVAGVKAKAFPPFPYGYAGGIPCCAAIREENIKSVVREL